LKGPDGEVGRPHPSCRDCVRACFPGVLETHLQEVTIEGVKVVLNVIVVEHPEKCDSEGRCLLACSHTVFPTAWPQDVDEVRAEAEAIIEKSDSLMLNTVTA
jgi:ferredoxin